MQATKTISQRSFKTCHSSVAADKDGRPAVIVQVEVDHQQVFRDVVTIPEGLPSDTAQAVAADLRRRLSTDDQGHCVYPGPGVVVLREREGHPPTLHTIYDVSSKAVPVRRHLRSVRARLARRQKERAHEHQH